MLIDSHCHLDYLSLDSYPDGMQGLLDAAAEQGVTEVLSVAVERANIDRVLEIASSHERVWASVGVHPLHADDRASKAEICRWAAAEKVVAIGETGLDYHYERVSPEVQRESFGVHLRAAASLDLPVIVHTREAREDTLRLLREHCDPNSSGVLHCFTEDWEMARQALDMGMYISISGIVTFRNATELREVVRRIPADRLLIETDSPYLAPVPHRGRSNEPALLPAVANCIAELRGVATEALAEDCNANFYRLFKQADVPR